MEAMLARPTGNSATALASDLKAIEVAMRAVLEKPGRGEPLPVAFHTPPPSFQRGQPLAIAAHLPKSDGVRLRYRHVNQAENWRMVDMELTGKDYAARHSGGLHRFPVSAAISFSNPHRLRRHPAASRPATRLARASLLHRAPGLSDKYRSKARRANDRR